MTPPFPVTAPEMSATQFKNVLEKLFNGFTEDTSHSRDPFLMYKENLKTAIEESLYLWTKVGFDQHGHPVSSPKELAHAYEWFHWITSKRYDSSDRGTKEGYGLCLDCMRSFGLGL